MKRIYKSGLTHEVIREEKIDYNQRGWLKLWLRCGIRAKHHPDFHNRYQGVWRHPTVTCLECLAK